jgi:predicted transcriptional regulator of viral defense system
MDINAVSRGLRASGLDLFSTRDLAVMFPPGGRALANLQLHQWARKGWIRRLKRGMFELALPEPAVISDLHIANRLYEPSYVSLDTALSHHGLIPDVAMQVTSVTSGTTKRFVNLHGVFTYFSVTPEAFRGYGVITVEGRQVLMAEPEKAVVDRLYAGLRRGEPFEPLVERWERRRLRGLNRKKLAEYAGLFGANGAKLKERINALT